MSMFCFAKFLESGSDIVCFSHRRRGWTIKNDDFMHGEGDLTNKHGNYQANIIVVKCGFDQRGYEQEWRTEPTEIVTWPKDCGFDEEQWRIVHQQELRSIRHAPCNIRTVKFTLIDGEKPSKSVTDFDRDFQSSMASAWWYHLVPFFKGLATHTPIPLCASFE